MNKDFPILNPSGYFSFLSLTFQHLILLTLKEFEKKSFFFLYFIYSIYSIYSYIFIYVYMFNIYSIYSIYSYTQCFISYISYTQCGFESSPSVSSLSSFFVHPPSALCWVWPSTQAQSPLAVCTSGTEASKLPLFLMFTSLPFAALTLI